MIAVFVPGTTATSDPGRVDAVPSRYRSATAARSSGSPRKGAYPWRRPIGRHGQRLDHVGRGPGLWVAASKVDNLGPAVAHSKYTR